ncbi:MAG: ferritin-like domain-containing protein, partial [Myxococcales bacterium]|nr:ferritin-like domain-containing protein [Myxococcales bacterium]
GTAQGGQGGSSQGGTAQGGQGGNAGVGGVAGTGAVPAFSVEGEVVCDFCAMWTTCFDPTTVPGGEGSEVDENGCPLWLDPDRTPNFCGDGFVDYWLDGSPFNGSCCYQSMYACGGGRPFMVGDEARVAAVVPRGDWFGHGELLPVDVSPSVSARLVDAWLEDAQMEHASVAAFARLTLELLALGAPADLVRDSQQAGMDEQRHAATCFRMASRFSGIGLGPGPLSMDGALRSRSLVDFAWCTFVEGCLGESMAALVAEAGAELASDIEIRAALTGIAADEARHAELAWRVLGWSLGRLDTAARGELLYRMRNEAVGQLLRLRGSTDHAERVQRGSPTDQLAAYGRVSPTEQVALKCAAVEGAVLPCIEALLAETQRCAA